MDYEKFARLQFLRVKTCEKLATFLLVKTLYSAVNIAATYVLISPVHTK